MSQIPSIGRIVHYTISSIDASNIKRQRGMAGTATQGGNEITAGQVYPMLIVRVWSDEPTADVAVQGQVFLDGNDTYWATSRSVGEGEGRYSWPAVPGRP
jgi:hypothetical protein